MGFAMGDVISPIGTAILSLEGFEMASGIKNGDTQWVHSAAKAAGQGTRHDVSGLFDGDDQRLPLPLARCTYYWVVWSAGPQTFCRFLPLLRPGDVSERHVTIDLDVLRQPKPAFSDDIALNLVGPARDR